MVLLYGVWAYPLYYLHLHTTVLTRTLLERYNITSANAFWKRSCLSRLHIINGTVYC